MDECYRLLDVYLFSDTHVFIRKLLFCNQIAAAFLVSLDFTNTVVVGYGNFYEAKNKQGV